MCVRQVFRILGLLELCIDTFEYPGAEELHRGGCATHLMTS